MFPNYVNLSRRKISIRKRIIKKAKAYVDIIYEIFRSTCIIRLTYKISIYKFLTIKNLKNRLYSLSGNTC